ncbi:MAG: multicopper oxidase domain-containing protein [Mycobacterium sp.]|nr:multicopper oxidase domain-containing protein [Mycobacterium sp.]
MSTSIMNKLGGSARRSLARAAGAIALTALACAAGSASAAVPGIGMTTGTSVTFNLQANQGYNSQPDGVQLYSWGYGCASGYTPNFLPPSFATAGVPQFCPGSAATAGISPANMQMPGPTLIVPENATVTVTLTNNLPVAAGNTSIVFAGIPTTSSCTGTTPVGTQGLLACEAPPGGTVTYTLNTTGKAGTHAYYSGTQGDLQIEMGMYGAIVVIPATPGVAPAALGLPAAATPQCAPLGHPLTGGLEYRHAVAAYDHPATCYDREYLWQWGEMDPRIHSQAETQVRATGVNTTMSSAGTNGGTCPTGTLASRGCLMVFTEPYHPAYFTINGRSMPDDMDPDYAPNYPAQPYNGNPHMHPLEQILIRTIGQGRWEHPFHEHGQHVRILARDGNLILSQTDPTKLAGLMMFNTDTWPGQAFDGIFYWSGRGVNWDLYGHSPSTPAGQRTACTGSSSNYTPPVGNVLQPFGQSASAPLGCNPECIPDANGYFTAASGPVGSATSAVAPMFGGPPNYALSNPTTASLNYGEWCADHNHPLEANPAYAVGAGGPMTLPDPLVFTNGLWYNGTPYLGPDAVARSRGATPLPPGGALQNPPAESGIAFIWHSHNERELTTDDVFPGGQFMMMLVDPPVWYIDETL